MGRPGQRDPVLLVCRWILRIAWRFAPKDGREEGLEEWEGELWALRRRGGAAAELVRFAIDGALHAFWRHWEEGTGMNGMAHDVRTAIRRLARAPAFTAAVASILTLGIGANTAVFSVVNSLLLRPLPYVHSERLGAIWPERFLSNREIEFLRENATTLDEVASFAPGWLMPLIDVEDPTQISGAKISGNLFDVLGTRPHLGRLFGMEAEAPGASTVVVLGYELWRNHFGGDPAVVGRSITLEGAPHTVVGIAPPGFQVLTSHSDVWMPLPMDPQMWTYAGTVTQGVARLAAHATWEDANAELPTLVAAMRERFGEPDGYGRGARILGLREAVVGSVRPMLLVVMGAVGFMLLIAASNVANLLLVRATERGRELALRASLGASRARLVRQLLTEGLVLAAIGGAAGSAAAFGGVELLRRWLPADLPRLAELRVDGAALALCAAATLVTGLLAGLAPALAAAAGGLGARLASARGTTHGSRRARGALVAVEICLAVVLLSGALLMVRTVSALHAVDPGFRAEGVLTMRVQPSTTGASAGSRAAFWREVMDRVAALPGIEAAGTVLHLPMAGRTWSTRLEIEGRPTPPGDDPARVAWQAVGGDYFRAMGIPLVRGRFLDDTDREDSPPVALVNESFVRQHLPGVDPLGRRFRTGNSQLGEWMTIVGVVGAVRHDSLTAPPPGEVYLPFAQSPVGATGLVVRAKGDAAALVGPIRDAIRALEPRSAVAQVMTMDEIVERSIARPRFVRELLLLFAAVGVLLAVVGIYGVVAFGVRQRRREVAIRSALGAAPSTLTALVLRSGLAWAAAGIVAGVLSALALSRALRGLVFGVSTTDPFTFISIPLLLLSVALLASWWPARRVLRVDPAQVLKEE